MGLDRKKEVIERGMDFCGEGKGSEITWRFPAWELGGDAIY